MTLREVTSRLARYLLREARERGEFDDLPHRGARLPLPDESAAGDMATAYHILRNAGVEASPWVATQWGPFAVFLACLALAFRLRERAGVSAGDLLNLCLLGIAALLGAGGLHVLHDLEELTGGGEAASLAEETMEAAAASSTTGQASRWIEDHSAPVPASRRDQSSSVMCGAAGASMRSSIRTASSQAGAAAAHSHTGALAGEDLVYDAAFKRAGIIRANMLVDLFSCADLLDKQTLPRGPNMAIITGAGGGLGLDALAGEGDHPVLERRRGVEAPARVDVEVRRERVRRLHDALEAQVHDAVLAATVVVSRVE